MSSLELPGGDSSSPWSERIIGLFCALFAVWTLCSQAVVFLGGSLLDLLIGAVSCLAFAAIVVAWRLWGDRSLTHRKLGDGSTPETPDDLYASLPDRRLGVRKLLGLIRAAILLTAVVGVPLHRNNPEALWWIIAICLSLGAFFSFTIDPPVAPTPRNHLRHELALWGISVACALYALACHRPDADDAFYINVAAAAADRPDLALLSADTLHGLPSLGLHLAVYKLHSWELWNGALSLLLDIPALSAFDFVSTVFVSILAPLAWASFLRRLTPKYWLPTLCSVLVVLIAVGDVHRWYGNFAFVRIWQGKALFLTVLLPLIWSYAIRFAQRPSWASGLWLAAAQVAAVGATSSALWAAPLAAATALVSIVSGRKGWLALVGVAVPSGYALLLGIGLRSNLEHLAQQAANLGGPPGALFGDALVTVLGDSTVMILSLIALAAAWTVAPAGPARRFASITPLAIWLSLLNPYVEQFVAVHLTGPSYWRGTWVLPVPLLLAFLLTAPLALSRRRTRFRRNNALGAGVLWIAMLSAFVISAPKIHGWSPENGNNHIGWPRYKIPPAGRLAQFIRDHVPAGAVVVAPPQVNTWLPVLRDRPYPLMVRDYLKLTGYPRRDRLGMIRLVHLGGRSREGVDEFRRGLRRFHVEAVLFYRVHPQGDAVLREGLKRARFQRAARAKHWELWVRRGIDPRGDPRPDRPLAFPFFRR